MNGPVMIILLPNQPSSDQRIIGSADQQIVGSADHCLHGSAHHAPRRHAWLLRSQDRHAVVYVHDVHGPHHGAFESRTASDGYEARSTHGPWHLSGSALLLTACFIHAQLRQPRPDDETMLPIRHNAHVPLLRRKQVHVGSVPPQLPYRMLCPLFYLQAQLCSHTD